MQLQFIYQDVVVFLLKPLQDKEVMPIVLSSQNNLTIYYQSIPQ